MFCIRFRPKSADFPVNRPVTGKSLQKRTREMGPLRLGQQLGLSGRLGPSLSRMPTRKLRELRSKIHKFGHGKMRRRSVAEEVGFEPTVRFHARRFSRPVHSTTLPLLRSDLPNHSLLILKPHNFLGKSAEIQRRLFPYDPLGAILRSRASPWE